MGIFCHMHMWQIQRVYTLRKMPDVLVIISQHDAYKFMTRMMSLSWLLGFRV
jgi:hypothetical protein